MKLRPPAIPLITVDPYFSVWSVNDRLNEGTTRHWTGSPNTIEGTDTVNGKEYALSNHGFTRDTDFPTAESTDSAVELSYKSDDSTKAHYP